MNIKKIFLTLSIKHQITIVLFLISFICLICILGLFTLYVDIIVSIQCRKRKEYIFQKYKQIIDSEIYFQTFLLHQYEQIIKGFNSQIYYYGHSQNDLFDTIFNFTENHVLDYEETTEDDYNETFPEEDKPYFLLSYSKDIYLSKNLYYYLSSTYSSMDNILNVFRKFQIPFFGDTKIINEYIIASLSEDSLFSINRTRIKEIEEISEGNIPYYYEHLIDSYVKRYKNLLNSFKKGGLKCIDIFFQDKFDLFTNYIDENYLKNNFGNNVRDYLNNISYNFQFIDYSTERTFVTDSGNINKVNFLEQNTIMQDYINIIFFKAYNNSNINVIPIFPENNSIMSVNLCYAFLYKQMIFINITSKNNIFEEINVNDIYYQLKKGVSTIDNCFLEKYYKKNNPNYYNSINIKFNKFYSIKNIREFSLFKLSETLLGEDFFYSKYTFPDYASVLNFKPSFFTLEQLNLYSFKPFYSPKHYYDDMMNFYNNCQRLIILSLLYCWFLIFFWLFYKLKQLLKEIIDPITNLVEIINHLDIKKEKNILKYEWDDSINELFKLCNDLILGKYKQKTIHEFEVERNIDQNENNKNISYSNNLKMNIKLIEEMIENKNEYNMKEDEIMVFNVNDSFDKKKKILINDNIKSKNEMRKTTILKKKIVNSNNLNLINVQKRVKKTHSINNTLSILNKKLSFDVTLVNNSDNLIFLENKTEEDIIEIETLLNYKHLFDIVDLVFNYDLKYDKKFISKNSKLLYKSNLRNYNRYNKHSLRSKSGKSNSEENKLITTQSVASSIRQTKTDNKIRIEDFDKSVMTTYETDDILFIWYEEAKYFMGEEFLQTNHAKELNNLCNLNINMENKNISNKQIIIDKNNNNSIKQKKVSILKKPNKEINRGFSLKKIGRKSKVNISE